MREDEEFQEIPIIPKDLLGPSPDQEELPYFQLIKEETNARNKNY